LFAVSLLAGEWLNNVDKLVPFKDSRKHMTDAKQMVVKGRPFFRHCIAIGTFPYADLTSPPFIVMYIHNEGPRHDLDKTF
jgi:hypothetical protein